MKTFFCKHKYENIGDVSGNFRVIFGWSFISLKNMNAISGNISE